MVKAKMKNKKIYTEEHLKFIRDNAKGKYNKELTELVNKHFGTNFTVTQIDGIKQRNKISSGLTGYFPKGNVPVNKGTKGMYNVGGNKTSFKKGNIPPNRVPIGTEKWKKYGSGSDDKYLFVKIQDGHLNKNWKAKHIIVYEEHYGPIPEKHKVMFADGDRTNFDIDNLILVSYQEQFIMNQRKLVKKDKELTKTGHLIAKVIDKQNKLRKK